MKVFTCPLSRKEIRQLKKEFGEYLKLTIDLEKEMAVAGGELHADGEKILLEKGSNQDDIWGGGINLNTKEIDCSAVLNLRPRLGNNSLEILDSQLRAKFVKVVKKLFKCLWKES